jgi:hypothetical protein
MKQVLSKILNPIKPYEMARTQSEILLLTLALVLLSCGSLKTPLAPEVFVENSTRLIPLRSTIVATDKLNAFYMIDNQNKLRKYNTDGEMSFDYVDNSFGRIDLIDITNPLSIMLYYKRFGIIKLLDNTLSEIKSINLNSTGRFFAAFPVCISNDNNYWVYDRQENKIFKVDSALQQMVETNHFNDLGMADVEPTDMKERGNKLLIWDKHKGFFLFDNFGHFLKNIPVTDALEFQFDGQGIMYRTTEGIYYRGIDMPLDVKVNIPEKIEFEKLKNLRQNQNHWFAVYDDGADIIPKR